MSCSQGVFYCVYVKGQLKDNWLMKERDVSTILKKPLNVFLVGFFFLLFQNGHERFTSLICITCVNDLTNTSSTLPNLHTLFRAPIQGGAMNIYSKPTGNRTLLISS